MRTQKQFLGSRVSFGVNDRIDPKCKNSNDNGRRRMAVGYDDLSESKLVQIMSILSGQ